MEKVVGFLYNNVEYIYERNVQGDILGIYKKDDLTKVVEYLYDAYGNHKVINYTVNNIGDINPIRYRGYYFDTETKLYYLNSRYYSAEFGRFISLDTLSILDETKAQINGLNLYMYCSDNPVMYSDESGCLPQWLGWLITGVVLVALTAATICTLGAAAPITGFAAGVVIGATCGAYAGAITSIVSQGMNNGWNNIDSWGVLKQTGIGTLTGAISGMGVGLGTTLLTGGLSQTISGFFDGSITSVSDFFVQFAIGAAVSGVSYGVGKFISNKLASSKISGIIGTSNKNSVINTRLKNAGFSYLKVGKVGMSGVVKELYQKLGYSAISSLVSSGCSSIFSILGGVL